MAGPNSPPLLLSVVPSEDQLDPKAPPPKHYTVSEFLNTIIRNNIELPDDDPPPVPGVAGATRTLGSDSVSTDSPVDSVVDHDLSPTRSKARARGKKESIRIHIDTPPKYIIIRNGNLDLDELWGETKNDPLFQHQPWLQRIANPTSKVIVSN